MTKYKEIKDKRKQVAILLGGKCALCGKSFGKHFNFHHIEYRKDEKKHSDFKSWFDYSEYVLPIISKFPDKFELLCKTCHHLITILQAIKDDIRFEKLVDLARRSRP